MTTSPASAIRAILFDKDGTLLDFSATWVPLNHQVALAAAKGDPELARRLLASGGHDPDSDFVAPGSLLANDTQLSNMFLEQIPDGRDLIKQINRD